MLYRYLALATLTATGVQSLTFGAIAVEEYARYDLPMVVGVAQWGTLHCDYSDYRIGRPVNEMSKLTRPCIGSL